jgi:cell division protein FtsN
VQRLPHGFNDAIARIYSRFHPMTAPTAPRRSRLSRVPQRRGVIGGTLIGVFIGIIVGLGMAATVAYWLMKNNPGLPLPSLTRDAHEPPRAAKVARADDKPRFDFYKILPGVEEPKVQPSPRAERGDRAVVEQAKERASDKPAERTVTVNDRPQFADKVVAVEATAKALKASDRFWLQAGSFSTEPDAENLRARLALAGWEATVQEGALPDRSVRYRVRLGPYDNADELGRMKSELARRGFDVAVIRY